jgi:hypothetical protein
LRTHYRSAQKRAQPPISRAPDWWSKRPPRPELAIFAKRARTLIGDVTWPLLLRHADMDFNNDRYYGRRIREIESESELIDFLRRFNWPWLTLEVQDRQGRAAWMPLWVDDLGYPALLDKLTQGGLDWARAEALDAKEVIRKYPLAGVRMYMGRCEPGNRGKVIYRIAKSLHDKGAGASEIACVLMASGAWQSKSDEQGARWGRHEIERVCAKLGKST